MRKCRTKMPNGSVGSGGPRSGESTDWQENDEALACTCQADLTCTCQADIMLPFVEGNVFRPTASCTGQGRLHQGATSLKHILLG